MEPDVVLCLAHKPCMGPRAGSAFEPQDGANERTTVEFELRSTEKYRIPVARRLGAHLVAGAEPSHHQPYEELLLVNRLQQPSRTNRMPPRGARARDDTEDSEGACFAHWQVARHPAKAQPFCHERNEMICAAARTAPQMIAARDALSVIAARSLGSKAAASLE